MKGAVTIAIIITYPRIRVQESQHQDITEEQLYAQLLIASVSAARQKEVNWQSLPRATVHKRIRHCEKEQRRLHKIQLASWLDLKAAIHKDSTVHSCVSQFVAIRRQQVTNKTLSFSLSKRRSCRFALFKKLVWVTLQVTLLCAHEASIVLVINRSNINRRKWKGQFRCINGSLNYCD